MNPTDLLTIGSVTLDETGYKIMTADGIALQAPLITSSNVISSISAGQVSVSPEEILDEVHMNRFAIDHKVTAAELLKLQEVAPDYASEIKENIAKNLARDITKKISYTKKHDKDTDVHHFIGRVWVFTEDELKTLLGKR